MQRDYERLFGSMQFHLFCTIWAGLLIYAAFSALWSMLSYWPFYGFVGGN